VSTPLHVPLRRLAGDWTHDVVAAAKRAITLDANANVQAAGVALMAVLCKRLRERGAGPARITLGPIAEKLREKKGKGLVAAQDALYAFVRYDCLAFDEVLEEVRRTAFAGIGGAAGSAGAASAKAVSPEQRVNALTVLVRIVSSRFALPDVCLQGSGRDVAARVQGIASLAVSAILDGAVDVVRYEAERLLAALLRRLTSTAGDLGAAQAHPRVAPLLDSLCERNAASHGRVLAEAAADPASATDGGLDASSSAPHTAATGSSVAAAPPPPVPALRLGGAKAATRSEGALSARSARDGDDSSAPAPTAAAAGAGAGKPPLRKAAVPPAAAKATVAPPAVPSTGGGSAAPMSSAAYEAAITLEAGDAPSASAVVAALTAGELVWPGVSTSTPSDATAAGAGAAAEEGTGTAEGEVAAPSSAAQPLSDVAKLALLAKGGAKDWQGKKGGVEVLHRVITGDGAGAAVAHNEAFMALLANGFDGNQHVVAASAAVAVTALAKACPAASPLTRRSAHAVVTRSAAWLKEKTKKALQTELTAMYLALSTAVGPNLTAYTLTAAASAHAKVPAVLERVNEVLTALVVTFGVGRVFPLPLLAAFAGPVLGMASANGGVRSTAKAGLAALYVQMGPPLEAALGRKSMGVDPKVLELIKKDLEATPYTPDAAAAALAATVPVLGERAAPRVTIHGAAPASTAGVGAADVDGPAAHAEAGGGGLFDRTDIATLLPKTLLADMDTPNAPLHGESGASGGAGGTGGGTSSTGGGGDEVKPWQTRLAALEKALAEVESAAATGGLVVSSASVTCCMRAWHVTRHPSCHVQMNDGLVAVVKAVGRRLTDTQANLRPKALAVLAALGRAVGPSIHSSLRHIGASRLCR